MSILDARKADFSVGTARRPAAGKKGWSVPVTWYRLGKIQPMNTTTDIPPPHSAPRRMPESQRSTYQFPVYRWINWLAVAGYGVGLVAMFFLSAMVGLPAAILWPFFVVLFCAGVALLGRPKALMNVMIFYFLLMPSNRLLGLLPLPLPGFIDELFFVPFIAVIVMNLIQGRTVKEGNWFPLLFGLVTILSWYLNGKKVPFTAMKILLVNLKFFIIWYFCRLCLTFKDSRELFRWCWMFILFAAMQFPYNVLWQRGPRVRVNPDFSGGVFGPDSYAAHVVGYISMISLFLLVGWSVTRLARLSFWKKTWLALTALVIFYDMVFMTDTKHVLVLGPLVCGVLLFLPGLSTRLKLQMTVLGILVLLAGFYYVSTQRMTNYWRTLRNFETTPKGQLFKAVTSDFPKLVPYPIFGAGPGRFASDAARENMAPLARRYIIPYYDAARRLGYYGQKGVTAISSVAGSVNTDFFYIISEFGWFGEAVYVVFWGYCILHLFAKGIRARGRSDAWGVYLALGVSLLLFMLLQLLTSVCTVACLAFPVWMLVGRAWDMEEDGGAAPESTQEALLPDGIGEGA